MAEATNSRKKLRMDSSLWSELPQDPLQEVLARLPLRSLAQYRAVSKTWKTEIAGIWKCGATLRSKASAAEEDADKYWLVFRSGFCYSPTINKSHQITNWLGPSNRLLATGGGIMLCGKYSYWGDDEYKLSVGNPLKESCWSRLPEHPPRLQPNYADEVDKEPVGFGVVADKDSRNFKVLIVISWGTSRTPLASHLYDSQSRTWKVIKSTSLLVDARPLWPNLGGVCYKNYLLYSVNPDPAEVNHIMAFNLKAETWHTVKLPEGQFIYAYNLLVCGGRLFITVDDELYTTVVIFEFLKKSEELDDLDGTWLMVGSLDRLLMEKTLPKWQGALPICPKSGSTSTRAPIVITCSARISSRQKLLFHVDESTWYKVLEFEETCSWPWPDISSKWCEHRCSWEDCRTYPPTYPAMVFTPRLEACACP